jgi:hypothetical protein
MLFRCEACVHAYCEDHLPNGAEIIGQCKRFQALGQRHPAQACFIRCSEECVKWAKERRLEEGGEEAEEAAGWTIGAKVALTDAWIEERDHEIELPLDPTPNGRSKPLAHATFTDLVHFLLRQEGPKRKDAAAAARRRKKEATPGSASNGQSSWEEEIEEMDPQPGDTLTIAGVKVYFTAGSQKLDEIAQLNGLEPKDLLNWNKNDLPGLTQKAYLLENTRLWLGPKPQVQAQAPQTDADPEAERRRRREELNLARLAAENAGINFDKKPRGDDEFSDEPMVLGRPLKGLRQKDIDPTEREAIMAEMFKRVRPLLERNIEKDREREKKRAEDEAKEHEEQRKQEQIRAERLLRRTEGIPVHLLSATASDFRSVGKTASSYDAPHGGDVSDATMKSMEDLVIRLLRARDAIEPDGTRVSAAELKVMMARAGPQATLDATRTRWEHDTLGEALGFVLAVCSLERAAKISLKRSEKYPEAVDLAAMRLTIPTPELDVDVDADAAAAAAAAADQTEGVMPAHDVKVQCGELVGSLVPGGKRGDEQVKYTKDDGSSSTVPATEFERLGGRGSTRKWRQSLRYVGDDAVGSAESGVPVGRFLREIGAAWRDSVVGRAMEVSVPNDERFYAAEVTGYKADSGEHEIMYADGNRDWIYLCLQTTRWPDGVPPRLAPEAKPTAAQAGEGAVNPKRSSGGGKSKSKGTKGGRGLRFDPSQMARAEAPEPTQPTGPPRGEQAVEGSDGLRAYYTADNETLDEACANLKCDFRDVLAWSRPFVPGLTRHVKLKENTRLWLQEVEVGVEVPPPRREGGGVAEVRTPFVPPAPPTTEGDIAEAMAADSPNQIGEKRKAEGEAGDGDAPKPKKKKKKKPKPGSANKPKPGDHEEDVSAEVESSQVVKATPVPVVFNGFEATFAAGCVSGSEEFAVPLPDPPPEPTPEPTPEPAADGEPPTADQKPGSKPPAPAPPPGPTHEYLTLHEFFTRAGVNSPSEDLLTEWKTHVCYGGTDAPPETPIGGWLQRRGATWGKASVGYQLEILNPDAARSIKSSEKMEKQGGTSWRVGEVVSYVVATGEHEVSFLDGSEFRCHLFLQTMRWLPTKYEPFGTVPDPPPDDGGMMMASPPLPVGCGGMRGALLPGGKRGEELVRYAAPRDPSTPGVMAEFTVPATEFERLGGKGTAKKWRQSLRLVAVGSYKLDQTMGKWLRTLGNLTGDASVGRHLEIFWPGDGAFYGGTVASYKTETGEHEVYYDDGGKETLQLSMQTVRWGPTPQPGARERMLKLAAEETERAKNEKGKKKSGGGASAGGGASVGGGAQSAGGVRSTAGGAANDEWIACDSCGKWRKVPAFVADALGDDDKWHCVEHPDGAFASCDVPEEKYE